MPGVYFRQQNSDDAKSLIDSFFCAVDYALNMKLGSASETLFREALEKSSISPSPEPPRNENDYWKMASNATTAEFPFHTWRATLKQRRSRSLSDPTLYYAYIYVYIYTYIHIDITKLTRMNVGTFLEATGSYSFSPLLFEAQGESNWRVHRGLHQLPAVLRCERVHRGPRIG